MKRRFPLWVALLPLAGGILLWAFLWGGHRDRLLADMQPLLPAGTAITTGGFPYRLEATVAPLAIGRADDALTSRLAADSLSVNRQPWQPDRQVLSLRNSVASLQLKPLSGAHVRIAAPQAQASLRMDGGTVGRLSIVWESPELAIGLLTARLRAERLEAHFRETPATAEASPSPRLPTQDQFVLSGKGVRADAGDPLAVQLDGEITGRAPVRSFAIWADGGTLEIRSLVLTDSTGEIGRIAATLVPGAGGEVRIAGTIETVCPASFRAALAGLPPVSEKRARKAQLLPFSGVLPAGILVAAADPDKPAPPVRGQEPPCPRLR